MVKRIVNKWIKRLPPLFDGSSAIIWESAYDASRLLLSNVDEDLGLGKWDQKIWRVVRERWENLSDPSEQILLENVTYKQAMEFIRDYCENHRISLYYTDRDVYEYERDYYLANGEFWNEEAFNDAAKLLGLTRVDYCEQYLMERSCFSETGGKCENYPCTFLDFLKAANKNEPKKFDCKVCKFHLGCGGCTRPNPTVPCFYGAPLSEVPKAFFKQHQTNLTDFLGVKSE